MLNDKKDKEDDSRFLRSSLKPSPNASETGLDNLFEFLMKILSIKSNIFGKRNKILPEVMMRIAKNKEPIFTE